MSHPSSQKRLLAALPPDAVRQLVAWIEQAKRGEALSLRLEKEEGWKVALTLPRKYSWGRENLTGQP